MDRAIVRSFEWGFACTNDLGITFNIGQTVHVPYDGKVVIQDLTTKLNSYTFLYINPQGLVAGCCFCCRIAAGFKVGNWMVIDEVTLDTLSADVIYVPRDHLSSPGGQLLLEEVLDYYTTLSDLDPDSGPWNVQNWNVFLLMAFPPAEIRSRAWAALEDTLTYGFDPRDVTVQSFVSAFTTVGMWDNICMAIDTNIMRFTREDEYIKQLSALRPSVGSLVPNPPHIYSANVMLVFSCITDLMCTIFVLLRDGIDWRGEYIEYPIEICQAANIAINGSGAYREILEGVTSIRTKDRVVLPNGTILPLDSTIYS